MQVANCPNKNTQVIVEWSLIFNKKPQGLKYFVDILKLKLNNFVIDAYLKSFKRVIRNHIKNCKRIRMFQVIHSNNNH